MDRIFEKLRKVGRRVFAMVAKDFSSELRTRSAVSTLGMFIAVSVFTILFAVRDEDVSPELLSGLLWVVIFFSGMAGLSRSFVGEEERGTAFTLQLFAPSYVVFSGKLVFNILLMGLIAISVSVLFWFFFSSFYFNSVELFLLTLLFGIVAFAIAATLVAAIVAKTQSHGALYTVLSFPPMIPLLFSAIEGTSLALRGGTYSQAVPYLSVLGGYILVVIGASMFLFNFVWKD